MGILTMKTRILILALLLACHSSFAGYTAADTGRVPTDGVMQGGVGADGAFHFLTVDNTGHVVLGPPTASSTSTTEVTPTALVASKVLKSSAGSLVFLAIHNTGATALSIMIINATSLPGNGAVSLLYPCIKIPAGGDITLCPPVPIVASTGITVAGSTTDTFSLTVGTAVLEIYGQVR